MFFDNRMSYHINIKALLDNFGQHLSFCSIESVADELIILDKNSNVIARQNDELEFIMIDNKAYLFIVTNSVTPKYLRFTDNEVKVGIVAERWLDKHYVINMQMFM